MEKNLNGMTLAELREIARKREIKSITKYRKAELIELLKDSQESLKTFDGAKERVFSGKEGEKLENTEEKSVIKKAPVERKRTGKNTLNEERNGKTSGKEITSKGTESHVNKEEVTSVVEDVKEEKNIRTSLNGESLPQELAESGSDEDKKVTERNEVQRREYHRFQETDRAEKIKPETQKINEGDHSQAEKVTEFRDRNGILLKETISHKRPQRNGDFRENTETGEKVFSQDITDAKGVLEIQENNNFGFLRGENYLTSPEDVYVSPMQIKRFRLKTGDEITGKTRPTREGEKFRGLIYVSTVNGDTPDKAIRRHDFDTLTPIYPEERLVLENKEKNDITMRIMDLISPIGKGQRGLIVAPPKAGKTTILKKIAQSMSINNPELKIIVLLIDERPEEVTDMKESIDGEVIYSTFDEDPSNHIKVAQMVLERARRMVEQGQDVVILLDSLTRLSRAYNLTVTPSGRTLSGGLDPAALLMPKKFFGSARNIRNGGSLTILATALVDTGSRMDDMIFEEFKGTGNMEVHLDRKLQERRVFPAVDISKSGTRREEKLLTEVENEAALRIRQNLIKGADLGRITENLISKMLRYKSNKEFTEKEAGSGI